MSGDSGAAKSHDFAAWERRYSLVVDSGSDDEPGPRYFKTNEAAWKAWHALADEWKPFADVRCKTPNQRGGIYWPRVDRQGRVLGA